MNEQQTQYLRQILNKHLEDFITRQENAVAIYEALLDQNPANPLLIAVLNKYSHNDPRINFFTNLRMLVLGRYLQVKSDGVTISIEEDMEPFSDNILDKNLSNLNKLGPAVRPEDLASYMKSLLQEKLTHIQNINRSAISAAALVMSQNPADREETPPERSSAVTQDNIIVRFGSGIGRGILNFLKRFSRIFLHPIDTMHNLWENLLYLYRVGFFAACSSGWENLKRYAQEDPVAFATDVVINIALIGLAIKLAIPAAAAASSTPHTVMYSSAGAGAGAGVGAGVGAGAISGSSIVVAGLGAGAALGAQALLGAEASIIDDAGRKSKREAEIQLSEKLSPEKSSIKIEGIPAQSPSKVKTSHEMLFSVLAPHSIATSLSQSQHEEISKLLELPKVKSAMQIAKSKLLEAIFQDSTENDPPSCSDKSVSLSDINFFAPVKTVQVGKSKEMDMDIDFFAPTKTAK